MKKITVILVLSFVGIPSLYSQIKFIPKVGTSFAFVRLSDDLKPNRGDLKSKFGVAVGVAADIPLLGEKISLQPELLFHQKGFSFSNSENDYSFKSHTTLNYLELPVLVKLKVGKFYAVAGPSLSLGIGGYYKTIESESGTTSTNTGKVKFGKEPDNNYGSDESYYDNRLDVGLQAGVGMQIKVIIIELRYAHGLLNTLDKPNDYSDGDYSFKTSSFLLTIGYPIGIKK